jgi:hypothetical protein
MGGSCERAAAERNGWLNHVYLSAAYAMNGDNTKAMASRDALLKMQPRFSIKRYREITAPRRQCSSNWQIATLRLDCAMLAFQRSDEARPLRSASAEVGGTSRTRSSSPTYSPR